MKKILKSVRGMHDCLPEEINLWNDIEKKLKEILISYCYLEIRLPLLEKTLIFKKSIGDITDVVEKEMYSFNDRNGKSLTLRPEGTVGCVRAVIQNNLLYTKHTKFWYLGPMFRYERPQMGRYRQFYQLGVEVFGITEEYIDLEIILLTYRFWKKLGIISNVVLEINSIGSLEDRRRYKHDLVAFLKKYEHLLDKDSQRRLYINPLRILDSKNQDVQKILRDAPLLSQYINHFSYKHFKNLCNMLNLLGIEYQHNQYLVRGLDYYNNTIFEWTSKTLGSQNAVCAGGRYDNLVENMGGPTTPAIGFAIGMERLILLVKSLNVISKKTEKIDIFIICIENNDKFYAAKLSEKIRDIHPWLKIFINFSNTSIKNNTQHAINSSARLIVTVDFKKHLQSHLLIRDLNNKKQFLFLEKEFLLKINHFFKKS
ncbi:MAG: histidine--tRNA ligase [Buchnera aphidicola (Pentalonia nigronervosa)]|uniref:Histidine--tRNA ligase n=1 Tax=Buchnera aphidicola (Pentalonia nigronervosa) TaxID=1309793 RepID=A0A7H1AZS4_9GAMM|nr:MAG: histidine--tRNA ligase [Buchnera aphidicola (Pentalonia nigronervosa)]